MPTELGRPPPVEHPTRQTSCSGRSSAPVGRSTITPFSRSRTRSANRLHRMEVVRDEHDCLAFRTKAAKCVEAFLLEAAVADCEHLIEEQDVEVDLDRDRVCESHLHSRGEVLQLLIHEPFEFRERDDFIEAGVDGAAESPRSVALMRMLSRAVSSGLNPTPNSMNGESRPVTCTVPGPPGRCRSGS